MSTLRFVKSLKGANVTYMQVLTAYMFNGVMPSVYDQTKTYSIGNIIMSQDPTTGKISFFKCNRNNVIGTYNPSAWDSFDASGSLKATDEKIDSNTIDFVSDTLSILNSLTAFIEKPVTLNHIYADNLKVNTRVTITKGNYTPGKLFI